MRVNSTTYVMLDRASDLPVRVEHHAVETIGETGVVYGPRTCVMFGQSHTTYVAISMDTDEYQVFRRKVADAFGLLVADDVQERQTAPVEGAVR